MANYYFGSPPSYYYPLGTGVYPNNGDWRDINQWYTTDGYNDKYTGWVNSTTLANTFPNPATDTVICYQEVLSGVGVYSSGSWISNNVWNGNVFVLFANTGTWTGNILGGFNVGGTANVTGKFIDVTNDNGYYFGEYWNYNTYNGFFTNRVRGGSVTANLQPRLSGYLSVEGGSISGSGTLNSPTITLSGNGTITYPTINTSSIYIQNTAVCPANILFTTTVDISGTANVSGSIVVSGVTGYELRVRDNPTIATDISTSSMGRFRYITITGGTFTNTNPWVFGNTTFASNLTLGVTTSKDITIYGRVNLGSNYWTQFTGGTYTGNLSIIPITGQSNTRISFSGYCTYSPAKTINVVSVGNNYTIASNSLPVSYGFEVGGTFSPRLTLLGLPVDILGAQIL